MKSLYKGVNCQSERYILQTRCSYVTYILVIMYRRIEILWPNEKENC